MLRAEICEWSFVQVQTGEAIEVLVCHNQLEVLFEFIFIGDAFQMWTGYGYASTQPG